MTNLNSDSVNLGSSPSPPTSKSVEFAGFSEAPPRNPRTPRNERSHKSGHTLPDDCTEYFDDECWQHRLNTGDHALIPPDSDTGLYILLGFILVGGAALFGASIYVLVS